MIKIEFLKKDDISHKIFMRLWENRKVRLAPKLPGIFNYFSGYYEDSGNDLFVYCGNLYIVYGTYPILNKPNQSCMCEYCGYDQSYTGELCEPQNISLIVSLTFSLSSTMVFSEIGHFFEF